MAPIWVRHWYAPDLPHQWIAWESWFAWRWGLRFPEDIEYRDVEVVVRKMAP